MCVWISVSKIDFEVDSTKITSGKYELKLCDLCFGTFMEKSGFVGQRYAIEL